MVFKEQESEMGIWLPQKENEELQGIVMEIVKGQYGMQLTIKKNDGALIKTPSHKVLQAKLSKVEVGDLVKIVYVKQELPKVKGENGAKIYKVFIDAVFPTEEKVV